jgi:hypothetical protein
MQVGIESQTHTETATASHKERHLEKTASQRIWRCQWQRIRPPEQEQETCKRNSEVGCAHSRKGIATNQRIRVRKAKKWQEHTSDTYTCYRRVHLFMQSVSVVKFDFYFSFFSFISHMICNNSYANLSATRTLSFKSVY